MDVEEVRGDVLVLKGGDTRAVLEIARLDLGLKSVDEQVAILEGFGSLLNGLDGPVQLLARAVPQDVQAYLDDLRAPSDRLEPEALVRLRLDHFAFVQALASRRNLLEHRSYAVIAGPPIVGQPGVGRLGPLPFPGTRQRTNDETAFDTARRQLAAKAENLREQFSAIGLSAHRLSHAELLHLLHGVLAPQQASRQHVGGVHVDPVVRHVGTTGTTNAAAA
jgi:hypothetical protein